MLSFIFTVFVSLIYNMILVLIGLFVVAMVLMLMINPDASPKEIIEYWKKNFKGEINHG